MQRIAVFAKELTNEALDALQDLYRLLNQHGLPYSTYQPIYQQLPQPLRQKISTSAFCNYAQLQEWKPEGLISVGGDGTMLDTLMLVQDSGVPVIGINTGRMGFLSRIPPNEIAGCLHSLVAGEYSVEARGLLKVEGDNPEDLPEFPYALNEFTVHKRDTSSMIVVETLLNDEYFNEYWADGLIVSTPTGSTAYSLSCGGPVIFPSSRTFAVTPVAPHNLNVRPIIIPDDTVISLKVSGRGSNYLISMDSRSQILDYNHRISISKAPFLVHFAKLNGENFISTLRKKLMWGLDTRNNPSGPVLH